MSDHASSQSALAELQRLESGKWRPSTVGGQAGLKELFAEDFLTVEYGADLHGLVTRRRDGKAMWSAPETAQLVAMLDATAFDLTEWEIKPLGADAVLLSYRVTAPAFGWTAYAVSAWQRHGEKWSTVFYQASRAHPAT